jgi:glucan 1,3-beta-glucosidase
MTRHSVVAGLSLFLTASAWSAMPALHADGPNIVGNQGHVVALRGTNLSGGFLYEPWLLQVSKPEAELPMWSLLEQRFGPDRRAELQRVWRESWVGDDDIAACRSLGMTCVRLPFGWWLVEAEDKPGQWIESGFAQLDRVVRACERSGLYVLLDLHGAPGGQSREFITGVVGKNELWASEANQARTVALWREIARRFAGRSAVVGYDLLNEPMGAPDAGAIFSLYRRIYAGIREVDPNHLIFLEDGFKGFEKFPAPAAEGMRNIVYSPHFYPFGYTKPEQQDALLSALHKAREWQASTLRIPVVVGEFSAVSMQNGGTDIYRRYMRELNAMGWGWLTWCWKHPCEGPSEDLWGIVNTPKSGMWRPPDMMTDSFESLQQSFAGLRLENWDYSPLVRPVVEEGLKGEFTPVQ